MKTMLRLDQDHHVHSTYSDGKNTIWENVRAAEARGLTRLGCVDHVRRDTVWVRAFAEDVYRIQSLTAVELLCGVEAKFLDSTGTLDVPALELGVDIIFAADHQVPLDDGVHPPAEVREAIRANELRPSYVVDCIVEATCGALYSDSRVVVAHLFSVLPKIGLDETSVTERHLDALAEAALRTKSWFEVDERWRAPGPLVVSGLAARGVELRASSDAHKATKIGRYRYVSEIADRLMGRIQAAAQ